MNVNFSEIVLLDIEGSTPDIEKPFHKVIADKIYHLIGNDSLDLCDAAMKINKGEAVVLSKSDIEKIRVCLISQQAGLWAYAKNAIIKYLDNLKEEDESSSTK